MVLFQLSFCCWGKIQGKDIVPPQSLLKEALFLFEVCRMVYNHSIEVKFDLGNHPKNFSRIIALYLLD